ncbi:MAG: hypothetical protein ACO1NX_09480 [Chitinophagaceae bacterium]
MARRIYTILGAIAFVIIIFLLVYPGVAAGRTLTWSVTLLYALFVTSIHGAIDHSLNVRQKGSIIFYPVFMGVLFAVLVFIYLFVVLPFVIPGFTNY